MTAPAWLKSTWTRLSHRPEAPVPPRAGDRCHRCLSDEGHKFWCPRFDEESLQVGRREAGEPTGVAVPRPSPGPVRAAVTPQLLAVPSTRMEPVVDDTVVIEPPERSVAIPLQMLVTLAAPLSPREAYAVQQAAGCLGEEHDGGIEWAVRALDWLRRAVEQDREDWWWLAASAPTYRPAVTS